MYEQPYPLYDEPEPFRNEYDHERTKDAAREYFAWFTVHCFERIPVLLNYFNEELSGDAEADLLRIGAKAALCTKQDWCAEITSLVVPYKGREIVMQPRPGPTIYGRSLAIDIGILLARLLLDNGRVEAKWDVRLKGKRFIDFQSPVVQMAPGARHDWYSLRRFDPKRSSIAQLAAICRGTRDGERWAEIYTKMLTPLEPEYKR